MSEKLETRVIAGQTLVELGHEFPNLVVIGGDLNKSTHANKFGAEFPDRFFDFGPAEQNMVSVAAGMAASGKIPVVSTFSVFATSRPYDQIRLGLAQSSLNVKIVATHAGIITGEDGISAHSIEDIALMTALPNFKVIVPSDGIETVPALREAILTDGPVYIRLSRPATTVVHENNCDFEIGKAEELRNGSDATIIACGIMVDVAIKAASSLASKDGIHCKVLNMSTIKPIDETAIIDCARQTGALITAEEHYIRGGLGSVVSQVVGSSFPVPIESVALPGYAESGTAEELLAMQGLTVNHVRKAVLKAVSRKI